MDAVGESRITYDARGLAERSSDIRITNPLMTKNMRTPMLPSGTLKLVCDPLAQPNLVG